MLLVKPNKIFCCLALSLIVSGCANPDYSKVVDTLDKERLEILELEFELALARTTLKKQELDTLD